jgi:hypothetical protein
MSIELKVSRLNSNNFKIYFQVEASMGMYMKLSGRGITKQ